MNSATNQLHLLEAQADSFPKRQQSRKGRFLWMDQDSREKYLSGLKTKINRGFFSSETVMERIIEEIAPVFHESLECDRE